MTELSSIGGAAASSSKNGTYKGDISPEQFMDLLIAELQNQNPLEPMKNNELMAQMTQVRSLQATQELVENLSRLTEGMEIGSGASLIGRLVYGKAENGQTVQGKVEGLVIQNDRVNLVISGYPLLPVANVEEVSADVTAEEDGDGQ